LVVTVGDATGVGGRSQEFCLATAARIAGSDNIVIASADSDGSDGPSDAAGGIVDGQTLARAKAAGIDVEAELANHNSNPALRGLGDTIRTGIRPTNVRDLRVIFVGGRKD
jgi:glycerate-2-kinase